MLREREKGGREGERERERKKEEGGKKCVVPHQTIQRSLYHSLNHKLDILSSIMRTMCNFSLSPYIIIIIIIIIICLNFIYL